MGKEKKTLLNQLNLVYLGVWKSYQVRICVGVFGLTSVTGVNDCKPGYYMYDFEKI